MAKGMLVVDTIGPHLNLLIADTPRRVKEGMEQGADEILAYAQYNAPWTDRTGAAREGLYTDVFEEDGDIVLELGHGVDYGIWLELIQDGRFAIIMPTLEALGDKVVHDAGGRVISVEEIF